MAGMFSVNAGFGGANLAMTGIHDEIRPAAVRTIQRARTGRHTIEMCRTRILCAKNMEKLSKIPLIN